MAIENSGEQTLKQVFNNSLRVSVYYVSSYTRIRSKGATSTRSMVDSSKPEVVGSNPTWFKGFLISWDYSSPGRLVVVVEGGGGGGGR